MILRLVPLWAVFLIPLAFWAPFEDAFKLPQSVLAVGFGLFLVLNWLNRPKTPRNIIAIPVLVFSASLFISSVCSGMFRVSDLTVFLSLSIGSIFLAVNQSSGRKIVSALILAGTISSLYSILQFTGLDLIPSPGTGAGLRPFSTMGNPDFLAAFLIGVLPLALIGFPRAGVLVKVVPVGSMFLALLLTQSRGAWLGMMAGLVSFPVLMKMIGITPRFSRKIAGGGLAILAIGLGFFYFNGQARERLAQTFNTGHFDAAGRLFMWKAGMGMIRENPVIGTGIGGFGRAYPVWHARGMANNPAFQWFYTENTHNDYLQIPAEMGLPLFGLLIWIWVIFICKALQMIRSGDRMALGILIGFISLQVDAVFNFPWYIIPTLAWFWIMLAVLAGKTEVITNEESILKKGLPGDIFRKGMALIVGLAVTFILLRNVQSNAWLKLSGDYLAVGRNQEARSCAAIALDRWGIWEAKSRAANNASLASYAMDDFISAEKYSILSLSFAPDMPASISQLALSRARLGRIGEAEKDCRDALALNPRQAEAWHVLGNLAYMRKDLKGALKAWERAFAENPSIPGLRQNLEVLRRGGKGKRG